MATEKRLGCQTPTVSFILPYEVTEGKESIDLYNSTGRTAQEWQELMMYDILAKDEDELWTHSKFGYSIPRRNGKNEIVAIRELYGLIQVGERILHTAHRTTTSHAAFERLETLINALGYIEKEDFRVTRQFGLETIEFFGKGKVSFRTRSSKGGLGEGFDLLVPRKGD